MSLTVSTSETLKLMNKKAKTITVYKRLKKSMFNDNGKLVTLLRSPIITGKPPYKPGWNKSDSKMKRVCTQEGHMIHHGIHVYLNKRYAEDRVKDDEVLVKMTVKIEDLLGVENNTATFKQIYISPKEYSRAVQ